MSVWDVIFTCYMPVSFLEVITDFTYSLETSFSSEIPAKSLSTTELKEESNFLCIGQSFCNCKLKNIWKKI